MFKISPAVRPALLALFLGVALTLTARAEPKPAFEVQLEARKLADGKWVFRVEGTADLPAGTRVHADLLYAKQTKAPPRLQREGQATVTEEVHVEEGEEAVEGGRITFHLGFQSREPYSGDYEVILKVPADGQPDDVRSHLAERGEFPEQRISARIGDPQQLETQRREVAESVRTDMIELWTLEREARDRFESLLREAPPGGEAWARTVGGEWGKRLDQVQTRNQQRCPHDLYWVEYYGRRYVDLLGKDLRALAEQFRIVLDAPAAEPTADALARADTFEETFQMWMEYLQFPPPKDSSEGAQRLAALSAQLREFATWFEATAKAPAGDPAAARARIQEWQGKILAAIAALTQSLSDFDFAPVAALTRDTTRTLRDAAAAIATGDAEARRRVTEALQRSFVTLQEIEAQLVPR